MQDVDHGLDPKPAAKEWFAQAVSLIRRARVENDPTNQRAMLREAERAIRDALRLVIPSIIRGELEIGFKVKPSDGLRDEQQWKTV